MSDESAAYATTGALSVTTAGEAASGGGWVGAFTITVSTRLTACVVVADASCCWTYQKPAPAAPAAVRTSSGHAELLFFGSIVRARRVPERGV